MQKPAPIDDPKLKELQAELAGSVHRLEIDKCVALVFKNDVSSMLLDAHTAGRNYCRAVVLAAIDTAASGYGADAVGQNAAIEAIRAHREAFVRFQHTTSKNSDALLEAVREVNATRDAMFAFLDGTPGPTPGQDAATGVLRTLRDAARAVVAAQAAGYRDGGAAVRAAIDAMARLLPPKDPTP